MRSTLVQLLCGFTLLYGVVLVSPLQQARFGAGFEEDIEAREEWERIRLCDPATGKIPAHIRERELQFAKNLPSREHLYSKYPSVQRNVFTQLGPHNVGGRTRAVAIDAGDTATVLAAGVSGGIWRSTNGGVSWSRTSSISEMHNVTSLVQDTRAGKQHIWYASTGELWGNSAEINGTGLYKSTDRGLSWKSLASTYVNSPGSWSSQWNYTWRIVVDHTNLQQDVVYCATALGAIQRSSDGGATWKAVLGGFGNSQSYFSDVAITPSGVLYAALSQFAPNNGNAVARGIYRSVNGTTWTKITPEFMPEKYERIVIGVAPSDETRVYFLANTPGTGFKQIDFAGNEDWNSLFAYRYVNGDGAGLNNGIWDNRSQNLPAMKATLGQFGDFQTQGSYDMYVKVKPDDPNTVFIGGTNAYRSTDGFTTKTTWNWCGGYEPGSNLPFYGVYKNNHPDHHDLLFYPNNPNKVLVATDGGLFATTNCMAQTVEWHSLNNGYFTTQFYTCAIPQKATGSNVVIGGLQDNGTLYTNSTSNTAAWSAPGLGDGSYCAIADDGLFYMSRQQGSIGRFELNNNGDVQRFSRIDPKGNKRSNYLFINPFALDPNNSKTMYLPARNILWRCSDVTLTPWNVWDTVPVATLGWEPLPTTQIDTVISAVAVSTTPENTVFFGTQNGDLYKMQNAQLGNPTPVKISPTSFPRANIECIAVNPRNADTIIVVFSNYGVQSLFFTGDGGKTWSPIGGNLEGNADAPSCRWVEMVDVQGTMTYFVGTSVGLFATNYLSGASTTWIQEGASTIGNAIVSMMDIRWSDRFMVIATHGNGMFSGFVNDVFPTPQVPTHVSILNNQKNILSSDSLKWNAVPNALSYAVELSTLPDFSSIAQTQAGIKDTFFVARNLLQGKKEYYWRVQSQNAGGRSAASAPWKFTTAIQSPTLLLPQNSSKDQPLSLTLTWNKVPNALRYKVQVGQGITFSPVVFDSFTTDTTIQVTGLQLGKNYRWQVKAIDGDGEGEYSSRFSFTTQSATSVEDEQHQYDVQVYPLPSQTQTTIRFNSEQAGAASFVVYDVQGRAVLSQSNVSVAKGSNSLLLHVGALPESTYTLILRLPNGTIKTQLVIQR